MKIKKFNQFINESLDLKDPEFGIENPYAITISDGHDTEWSYFPDEETARNVFNSLKETETDIHLYEYTEEGYEVIDSYNEDESDLDDNFEEYEEKTEPSDNVKTEEKKPSYYLLKKHLEKALEQIQHNVETEKENLHNRGLMISFEDKIKKILDDLKYKLKD